MKERIEIEDRELRASIHHAELLKLTFLDRYQRHSLGQDPRYFPFQAYGYRLLLPIRREVEIERLITPFHGRYEFLLFYLEGEHRYRTHTHGKATLDAIQGRLYGWGWPLRGVFIDTFGGPTWHNVNE